MNALKPIAIVVLVLGLSWFVWEWGFCRFYVNPDQMAIITAKAGEPLKPNQILAKKGQKGIWEDVLGEGRYFFNPIMFDHEIRPVVSIPAGKIGIVTSKVGEELPEGDFLAETSQKGIWRRVLGPGKYRMNPYGYKIDLVDAVSIPIGYAGVITSLSGVQAPAGEFADKTQKGVRKDVLQPGLYYVNPKEIKVDVLEVGLNQVSLLGKIGGEVLTKSQLDTANAPMQELQNKMLEKQAEQRRGYFESNSGWGRGNQSATQAESQQAVQAVPLPAAGGKQKPQHLSDGMPNLTLAQFVEFPSRDGFQISLDMTVEVELLPAEIAWIFSTYGDLPAVVDKIIMPQITSIARNKGSEYGAKDFVVGEGREKFQTELTKALSSTLAQKKIIVHNALIRHVEVPAQILDPIQQAGIAVEQNLTNKEKQNTAKKQAELNTETSLIEQNRAKVAQETLKIKAETVADQEKQVAELKAEAMKQVAEIDKQTAIIRAEKVRKLGVAEAVSLKMVDGEKANGQLLKAKAFGDATAYTLWELARNLNPNVSVNILHSGNGTLWTDLEKARAGDLGGALMIRDQQKKEK